MTREQLQTAADVIRTLLNDEDPKSDNFIYYERLLNLFTYRWSIFGKLIGDGEVYRVPNPSMVWYKSEGKELK